MGDKYEVNKGGEVRFQAQPLTTAARNTINNPEPFRFIYNIDRKIIEWFEGDVWLNSQLTKAVNQTGGALNEGEPVIQDSATDDGVDFPVIAASTKIVGPIVEGGANGAFVTVATGGGVYNVLCQGAIARGDHIEQSTTAGEARTTAAGAGIFANARGTKGAAGTALIPCFITPTERF